MNHKQLLEDYYCVCDITDDNLEMVVSLIHLYQTENDSIGRIRADINDWADLGRLERYAKTFKNILSFDIRNVKHVIAIKQGKIGSQCIKIDRSKIEQHRNRMETKDHHHINSLFEEYP